jgi:hypothetical protein
MTTTTGTRHTTAIKLHAAILAAAATAPGSKKNKVEIASIFDRAERAAWFFSDAWCRGCCGQDGGMQLDGGGVAGAGGGGHVVRS